MMMLKFKPNKTERCNIDTINGIDSAITPLCSDDVMSTRIKRSYIENNEETKENNSRYVY